MPTPEQEALEKRNKHTLLLLICGAVSLLLPLLGIVYIRVRESQTARPPGPVAFERRENGESKVSISPTVTIINPAGPGGSGASGGQGGSRAPGGSSLDFVKSGGDNTYFRDKAVTEPAAPAPPPPAESAAAPKPSPRAATNTPAKKSFSMPKLQGTKDFNSFKGASSPKPLGGQGMTGAANPHAGATDSDMADMLKQVPGGINNPEVQKYLKSQGK